MDLFAAAGIDLHHSGRGGRVAAARTLRIPLFNYKVVAEARKHFTLALSTKQTEAVRSYVKAIKAPAFAKRKETEVRNLFVQKMLGDLLGYTQIDSDPPYTLAFERTIRRGSVDVALGRFGLPDRVDEIVAPFELKGPGTRELDAIMPGRGRSPVQQAWDYAIDAPGSRWVLVSNCVEVRLYGFGRGRDAYELFDLTKLDDEEELARLCLILSADRLLGGATDALLRDSDGAYKNITNELYSEYKGLRDRLIGFLTGAADGPKLTLLPAIELAQKLLDRVLFIAFAQRTDLLPDRLLERALAARNEFLPQPLWRNFQALFRNIDRGNDSLYIWAYNGGLFAADPAADGFDLPDRLASELAKLGQWDYRSDVPVTVLGHLFEQSITDLEKLRAESRGEMPPKVSKRKREGVVYTPEIVTRFLVEHTVGRTLEERFVALLAAHADGAVLPKNGDLIPWREGEMSERAFWREYAAALRNLTIVDPACGSGAFLVAAFDLLAAEYRRVVERLESLSEPVDFDLFDEIVTRNLYGVDLNAESVEITRLALWLKTARNKHHLQNLEATIKIGNSLIDDPAFTDRPFDWRAAFGNVFAEGGFDVVIGNPPYVRMEFIKAVKPYLEKHYVVAADRADLYAYFFERGVEVLRERGRLGYISSSTFFRAGSGENLRRFLGDRNTVEAVVDFGDIQIFEGVTTYPAILTLRKGQAGDNGVVSFLKVDSLPKDLEAEFASKAQTMPRTRLGHGSWQLETAPLAKLRDKIVNGKKTLREVYGPPLYGIKTGFNDAFVIDTATRDLLIAQDPKSADLLKPFLRGEDVKRWRIESEGLFLINTPKGRVNIDNYPAIRDWLAPFRPELEKRATKQEWFELQQAQLAYQAAMSEPKLVWSHFQDEPSFVLDRSGALLNNKCFFVPTEDPCLLALLNSRCFWFQLISMARVKRGGYVEAEAQYVGALSMPTLSSKMRNTIIQHSDKCTLAAMRRFELLAAVRHRILDLAPDRHQKLSRKLEDWHDLNFSEFRAEVERVFHTEIALRKRAEWEKYLAENAAEVKRMTAEVEAAEREIDSIIYRLFDLVPDEIALLEASLAK
jgi:N-6 DNA Methylase/TaqI-like C-terminal specificity domain